ncbi:MAG TPA: hypothetical protein VIL16_12710 [Trebonia sp.]
MKRSSGPTTVGPDTTRIAPSISAAWTDRPNKSPASAAATSQVSTTPTVIRRVVTRRVFPRSLARSRARPASYKITPTASETKGWNAVPSSRCGLTSAVSAPTTNPTGSRMISAGMRSRLASTCEPTASSRIRPTPNRTWSVLTTTSRRS